MKTNYPAGYKIPIRQFPLLLGAVLSPRWCTLAEAIEKGASGENRKTSLPPFYLLD
jgi:hypothetical protein